jgi:hypothetical protein
MIHEQERPVALEWRKGAKVDSLPGQGLDGLFNVSDIRRKCRRRWRLRYCKLGRNGSRAEDDGYDYRISIHHEPPVDPYPAILVRILVFPPALRRCYNTKSAADSGI